MGTRDDALKRIIAEVIQQDHRFKDILRRIVDLYPDATAAEIADAYRDVMYGRTSSGTPDPTKPE